MKEHGKMKVIKIGRKDRWVTDSEDVDMDEAEKVRRSLES